MPDMILTSFGRVRWDTAREHLAGLHGLWLGPAGPEQQADGPWPVQLPLTTRIHAWTPPGSGPVTLWRLIPHHSHRAEEVLLTRLEEPGHASKAGRSRQVSVDIDDDGAFARYVVKDLTQIQFMRFRGNGTWGR